MGIVELLFSFLVVYGALYIAAVLVLRLARGGARRRQLRLSALLFLVAVAAVAFRVLIYPDESLTVEVRNASGWPLHEVALVRTDAPGRVELGRVAPRTTASRSFRPFPTGRWAVTFRRDPASQPEAPQPETVPMLVPRSRHGSHYLFRVYVGKGGASIQIQSSNRRDGLSR